MNRAFFKPCFGKNYLNTKTLLLSESAYSWREEDKICDPPPSHPKKSLNWAINHPKPGYFRSMSRAICGEKAPSADQMIRAWDDYAYTIYVQGTVGLGAR